MDLDKSKEEIEKDLQGHAECATIDDFPNVLHLNYASHRRFTFISDKEPSNEMYYYGLADQGFYYLKSENIVKCYFCSADLKKIPCNLNSYTIHKLLSPGCPMVTEDDFVGNVHHSYERLSRDRGLIMKYTTNRKFLIDVHT